MLVARSHPSPHSTLLLSSSGLLLYDGTYGDAHGDAHLNSYIGTHLGCEPWLRESYSWPWFEVVGFSRVYCPGAAPSIPKRALLYLYMYRYYSLCAKDTAPLLLTGGRRGVGGSWPSKRTGRVPRPPLLVALGAPPRELVRGRDLAQGLYLFFVLIKGFLRVPHPLSSL